MGSPRHSIRKVARDSGHLARRLRRDAQRPRVARVGGPAGGKLEGAERDGARAGLHRDADRVRAARRGGLQLDLAVAVGRVARGLARHGRAVGERDRDRDLVGLVRLAGAGRLVLPRDGEGGFTRRVVG